MNKREIFSHIFENEGGYVNHPNDPGGETNFGITKAVAEANGYHGQMRDLPFDTAVDIYSKKYWTPISGDELLAIDPYLALNVFDMAVNAGVSRSAKMLQSVANALSDDAVVIDGHIGPKTIAVISQYTQKRNNVELFVYCFYAVRSEYYVRLANSNDKYKSFIYGWQKRALKCLPPK